MLLAGKNPAEVFRGLVVILEKRGHQSLLSGILAGVLRHVEAARPAGQASLTVASEASVSELKSAIESALKTLNATEKPTVIIDQSIIGGFIATTDTESIDASYKRKLIDLYRSITT